jgi:hypothetical protein
MLAFTHFRGTGPEETWSDGKDSSVKETEIQRQMMPFETPTPSAGLVGQSKDRDVIEFDVSYGSTFLFVENLFEQHHFGCLKKTPVAESRTQESVSQYFL